MKYRNALSRATSKPSKFGPAEPKRQKSVEGLPEKAAGSGSESASAHCPAMRSKVNLKKAMIIYSRVHNKLRLKFETLFRAVAIYKEHQEQSVAARGEIPEDYLLAACMFVAMKYEEIYPPELRKVMSLIRPNMWLDMPEYCRHERSLILALGGDFDLPTPATIIDEMLARLTQDRATRLYAFFLLELGLVTDCLATLEFKEICLGVMHIMTRLGDFLKRRKSVAAFQEESIHESAK